MVARSAGRGGPGLRTGVRRVPLRSVPAPPTDLQAAFITALRGDAGPMPPGPRSLSRDEVAATHRRRIIAGMAQALATRGLAHTTIADVVREAQVSRRTFYELFDGKISCLLATYDACWEQTMGFVEAAVAPDGRTWQQRVNAGLRAYLQLMGAMPGLARVFILEMPSSGPEAQSHIRGVHREFAALLTRLAEEQRDALPEGVTLDPLVAIGVVGGVNELVVHALAAGENPDTPSRERTAMRLLLGAMQPYDTLL